MMKQLILVLIASFFICPLFSQDCEVLVASIQGKYTGGCKNSKANGAGKSEGTDTYEGNFKSGYPSGEGTYTYKNGDFYKGNFKNGLKDGKGSFYYKASDSTVTGYWKEDVFAGAYKHPYEVLAKSVGIDKFEVRQDVGQSNTLTINSRNVIKSNSLGTNTPPPLPLISYFEMTEGSYERQEKSSTDKISTLVIYGIKFPFHAHFFYQQHDFEILISKPGVWSIETEISQRNNF